MRMEGIVSRSRRRTLETMAGRGMLVIFRACAWGAGQKQHRPARRGQSNVAPKISPFFLGDEVKCARRGAFGGRKKQTDVYTSSRLT